MGNKKVAAERVPGSAATELMTRIQKTLSAVKDAEFEADGSSAIHKRDLEILQKVSDCVTKGMHHHAFLYFHGLEPVIRESLPKLGMFLSSYQWQSAHIRSVRARTMNEKSCAVYHC